MNEHNKTKRESFFVFFSFATKMNERDEYENENVKRESTYVMVM